MKQEDQKYQSMIHKKFIGEDFILIVDSLNKNVENHSITIVWTVKNPTDYYILPDRNIEGSVDNFDVLEEIKTVVRFLRLSINRLKFLVTYAAEYNLTAANKLREEFCISDGFIVSHIYCTMTVKKSWETKNI